MRLANLASGLWHLLAHLLPCLEAPRWPRWFWVTPTKPPVPAGAEAAARPHREARGKGVKEPPVGWLSVLPFILLSVLLSFLLRLPSRLARAEQERNKLSPRLLFGGMLSRGFYLARWFYVNELALSRAEKRREKVSLWIFMHGKIQHLPPAIRVGSWGRRAEAGRAAGTGVRLAEAAAG